MSKFKVLIDEYSPAGHSHVWLWFGTDDHMQARKICAKCDSGSPIHTRVLHFNREPHDIIVDLDWERL